MKQATSVFAIIPVNVLALNLRRRRGMGAQVEEGKWKLDVEPILDPEITEQFDKLQYEEPRSLFLVGPDVGIEPNPQWQL